ncbi:hypothetical protein PBT90_15800 [Algoriphagus halophytocola]|uniref:Uncharacterized protein n=1 Tax=Algoriphagus halophytocola TaxID=2991499 RepID=A0ABY6MBP2_9BACT|nr:MULTISPECIES: hypothetical protein [unclassified Algoriphagus]UZD21035.1 hypothetical protein OM944_10135 [Algoriphagus sp. TR-M5]WBL42201.1 hypothetical protein PBT90_15800 [Algoriphagus sp. TR-M9]
MKFAIFTWLLFLPIQIYAGPDASTMLSDREEMLQLLRESTPRSPRVFGVEIPAQQHANYELAMRIIKKDNAIIQRLKLQDEIDQASLLADNEAYKAITLSQEQDIQKLRNALTQKTHEINSQAVESWKYQSATLIFFVGMISFVFLYIQSKVNFSPSESFILSPLQTQEK